MTKEEAIARLKANREMFVFEETKQALDMAIEALQTLEAVERIKTEVLPQTDLVRCKDCRYQEHCHKTVAHTNEHDGFREHWSETIEWCSRGERREK